MNTKNIDVELREAFEKAFPGNDFPPIALLPATDAKFGDYQCNDAMKFAKLLHLPPRKIAEAAVAQLATGGDSPFAKVEVAGPGFINATVSADWLAGRLGDLAADGFLGVPQSGAGKKVVIDYSSPNAAKQMHIGHIRSTVIGNALDRIFRGLGYDVVADNHLGDWGTQFGILIKGYRELLTQDERDHLTVANLEKCYVLSAARAKEEDGVWKDACRAELVKLQQGDPDDVALWKRFIDISIGEFDRMYAKLGVKFDTYRGESYYNDMMPAVLERLEKAGLSEPSEGALIVNLEGDGLGVAIVRKSDGGFNYTTSDLACVDSRVKDYAPERIVYVTDDRQQLHFKQFFKICEKLGYATKLVHVPFGLMSYGGKAISTREGNLIRLDDLLAEAVRRALAIVRSRDAGDASAEPTPGQIELAEQIGFGAVKYADLSHDPGTAIDFNWDKALALEGNSGPYLQYAHARVCSLLAKAPGEAEAPGAFAVSTPSEKQLALQLLKFGGVVARAADNYKPSILADYLFQTAQLYSSFYQNSPILKSEPAVRAARLRLCALFGRVLAKGLDLLGIAAPSRI
ncbi:MAG: arginine--tRNA ligase [Kiritimatiellae bacterium]|nr:arginine--tRNA ligase [Kiritimatiellia bacterium]